MTIWVHLLPSTNYKDNFAKFIHQMFKGFYQISIFDSVENDIHLYYPRYDISFKLYLIKITLYITLL